VAGGADFASAFIASLLLLPADERDAAAPVATAGAREDPRTVLCNFVRRVLQRGELSYVTLLLALLYLHRLRDVRQRWPREVFALVPGDASGCAEFLTAIMLADKYLYDAAFANQFWAGANGRYTLAELNGFEWRLLHWLEYDLYVSESALQDFIAFLEAAVVLRQASGRGRSAAWSYGEVVALSTTLPTRYARDLGLVLPPRSALALLAKALCGAAAVYASLVLCLLLVASLSPPHPPVAPAPAVLASPSQPAAVVGGRAPKPPDRWMPALATLAPRAAAEPVPPAA
jgi:hypothetical protein